MTQDLGQPDLYVSGREGSLRVREVATTHAARALAKLAREQGEGVRLSVLGLALARRAELHRSEPTMVAALGDGNTFMLRDPGTGRWAGVWRDGRAPRGPR